MKLSEFGLFGLGVMGQSLSLNIASKGIELSVYNRSIGSEASVVSDFLETNSEFKNISGFTDIKAFVNSLQRPRSIFLMISAGPAVDAVIDALMPYLDTNDIIIDGGNSFFKDTQRRSKLLDGQGFHFIGCGVSGGEQGALLGPSIMPGGTKKGYDTISNVLESIAAKDKNGLPCCTYIGKDGAGHFVKMVHNGIEYAEMQLLAELYSLLKINFNYDEISEIFSEWNEGELSSYLLEITAHILKRKEGEHYLLDLILDKAGNKGTGSWSSQLAMQLGTATSMMTSAVFARYLSSFKEARVEMSLNVSAQPSSIDTLDVGLLKEAYHFAKTLNHHQGFQLLQTASESYQWELNLSEIARIWTNGCIIKSDFMERCSKILNSGSLLSQPEIFERLKNSEPQITEVLQLGLGSRTPLDTFHSAYNYWISMTSEELPANLIQAQRDYFGAHTYLRNDHPATDIFHTNWIDG